MTARTRRPSRSSPTPMAAPARLRRTWSRLGLSAVVLPFSSVLIDRLPRKLFLIGTDLIRAVLVGIAALTIWLSGPPVAVLAIAVLAGLVGAPFRPAQQAILPSLADTPQELTAANGVSSTLEKSVRFVGPALGALLLGVADVPAVFVLNVATFLWSASIISRLVLPAPAVADDGGGTEPPEARGEQGKLRLRGLGGLSNDRPGWPDAAPCAALLRPDPGQRCLDGVHGADRGRRRRYRSRESVSSIP